MDKETFCSVLKALRMCVLRLCHTPSVAAVSKNDCIIRKTRIAAVFKPVCMTAVCECGLSNESSADGGLTAGG